MLGLIGELLALDYLVQRGFIFLCWNLHTTKAQIDLVFLHPIKNELVGVEVKSSLHQQLLNERSGDLTATKLFLRDDLLNNFRLQQKLFNFETNQSLIKLQLRKSGMQSFSIKTIEYNPYLLV